MLAEPHLPDLALPVQGTTARGEQVRLRALMPGEARLDTGSEYDDWGPFDGVRRVVGPKNAHTAGGERTQTRLYHLPTDRGQEEDLAEERPEVLGRMQALLTRKLRQIDAPKELMPRFGLDG